MTYAGPTDSRLWGVCGISGSGDRLLLTGHFSRLVGLAESDPNTDFGAERTIRERKTTFHRDPLESELSNGPNFLEKSKKHCAEGAPSLFETNPRANQFGAKLMPC